MLARAGEVVSQAEQEGLALLHGQTVARGAGGKFVFDRREDGFDQGAPRILSAGKRAAHFGSHSVDAPRFLAALGRDNALRT